MCYRPFHLVEYYRYMRFFIDGELGMNIIKMLYNFIKLLKKHCSLTCLMLQIQTPDPVPYSVPSGHFHPFDTSLQILVCTIQPLSGLSSLWSKQKERNACWVVKATISGAKRCTTMQNNLCRIKETGLSHALYMSLTMFLETMLKVGCRDNYD